MTRTTIVTLIGIAVLCIAGSPPVEPLQERPRGRSVQADPANQLIRLLDSDGDGALNTGEIEQAGTRLAALDTSKDGILTNGEIRARLRSISRNMGRFGFDFGGTSEHDRPPLAKTDQEKKILAVLEEMKQGRWYLNVTTREGRLLRQLTEAVGAKRVVEIGTSSGYSTLWLALGLRSAGGRIFTHEIDPDKVKLASKNFEKAGVSDLITIVEGNAHETIKKLEGPIDVVFLDAEKKGYIDYLEKLLPLVRPGGLILGHDMNVPRPDPRYIDAITKSPDLESSFVFMSSFGISVTVKKR